LTVDGTAGTGADMPGTIDFQVSPDGSATPASALKISQNKLATFAGAATITGTTTHNGSTSINEDATIAAQKKLVVTSGGANPTAGTFVCNGTTPVTVTTAAVVANSHIDISLNTVGGTVGALPRVVSKSSGTSFNVAGTASDTSTYNWRLTAMN